MYLIIHPPKQKHLSFTLCEGDKKVFREFFVSNREFLHTLDSLLQEAKKTKNDIKGIALIQGGESFAGTRVAATIANTWSYALAIPVINMQPNGGADFTDIENQFKQVSGTHYVRPLYSGEPNIGQSR